MNVKEKDKIINFFFFLFLENYQRPDIWFIMRLLTINVERRGGMKLKEKGLNKINLIKEKEMVELSTNKWERLNIFNF